MKKIFLSFIIAASLILVSCKKSEPQEHQHNYVTKEVLPTCEEEGYKEHSCMSCQDTYRTNYTPKIPHYFSPWENITIPTCEKEGERKRVCIYCGYEEKVVLSCTEHIYEIKETVPASCEEDGYSIFECQINHEHQYKATINKTGHSFKAWEIKEPAQCDVKGLRISQCSSCSYYLTEDIPALGHQYVIKEVIPATCEKEGIITYECQHNKTHIIQKMIDPIGHNYQKISSTPATCDAEGKDIYECQNDKSHRYEETFPKGNHSFGSWYELVPSTCTEEGLDERQCLFCGKKETKTSSFKKHQYGDPITIPSTCMMEGYTMTKCKNCGYEKIKETFPKVDCQFGDWQILEVAPCDGVGIMKRVCSVCSKEETKPYNGSHHFNEWITIVAATEQNEGTKERECSICHHKEKETIPVLTHYHNYSTEWTIDKEATCTEVGSKSHHCLGCNSKMDITEIPALEHQFSDWYIKEEATCTMDGISARNCQLCGMEETERIPASHQLENNICTICGYEYIPYVIINDENNPFDLQGDIYYSTITTVGTATLTVKANVDIVIYFRMGANVDSYDNYVTAYVDQKLSFYMILSSGEETVVLYTIQVAKDQTFKLTLTIDDYVEGLLFWIEDLVITEDIPTDSNE